MATEDVLRRMRLDEPGRGIQEPASVAGLSEVSTGPPMPARGAGGRWREEIDDPGIECFVIERAGASPASRPWPARGSGWPWERTGVSGPLIRRTPSC